MSLLLSLLLACSSPEPPPAPPPAPVAAPTEVILQSPPDEVARQAAEALLPELADTHFASKTRRKVANARLFVDLASRDTREHALAAASLEAMGDTWTHVEGTAKPVVDADYATVVLAYLGHSEALLVGRALHAAKPLVRHGHTEVTAKVAGLASKSSTMRFEVLDVLALAPDWYEKPELSEVFVTALDGEAHLASRSLFRLEARGFSLVGKEAVAPKVAALLQHADPGVRGRAAIVYAVVESDAAVVAEAVAPLLTDTHPFTRSMAARAVGRVRATSLADELVAMLGDTAPNTYTIDGIARLDGRTTRLLHDGSAWSRVDDAALSGLRAMSGSEGTPRLEYTKVRHDHVAEDLATRVQEARTWYEAHKAALAN